MRTGKINRTKRLIRYGVEETGRSPCVSWPGKSGSLTACELFNIGHMELGMEVKYPASCWKFRPEAMGEKTGPENIQCFKGEMKLEQLSKDWPLGNACKVQ